LYFVAYRDKKVVGVFVRFVRRFTGLGDIPILGALFRSTRFEQDDKSL
jgi:hypothetical protein